MRAGMVNLLLILSTLGVAAWTALQALEPTAGYDLARIASPQVEAALPDAARMHPAPALAADLTERPLFWHGRRPLAPRPPETAAPAEPAPLDLVLSGVVTGSQGNIALVTVDGDVRRVRAGQRVGGWTVTEVRAREIELSRGGEKRIIPLLIDGKPASSGNTRPANRRPAGEAPRDATPIERLRDRLPDLERPNRQRKGS